MAAALLASGCEKFVRDELMHMQNEIDKIYGQVELLNGQLSNLRGLNSILMAMSLCTMMSTQSP